MSPTEHQTITENAAASAARRVNAQLGETAEQAAQIATASLFNEKLAKIRRIGLISLFVCAALLAAFFVGSRYNTKTSTSRPQNRATAKCIDGTWSYAATRQGACAAHGGVKTFYK